jgi:hypothetical protein
MRVHGRAVDRPVFWWSAAAIFLVNAWISLAAGLWLVAVLQALTSLWALVAGATAWIAASPPRESAAATEDDAARRP